MPAENDRASGGVPAGMSRVQVGVPASDSAQTSFVAEDPAPPPNVTIRSRAESKIVMG